ncbi:unnamed protein product, partial [Vitis vinifera]
MSSCNCHQLLSPLPLALPSSHSPPSLQTQPPPSIQKPTASPLTSKTPPKPTSPSRSTASWVDALRSRTRSNDFREAISTYIEMTVSGARPDNFAFPAVLKAVSGLQDLKTGEQIHAAAVKFGYGSSSVTVANTLVNMYGKCGGIGDKTFTNNALMAMYAKLGRVDDSKALFESFVDRDMVSWNTMISSFSQSDRFSEALAFFRLMVLEGVELDGVTIASVLPACSHLERLDVGKEIHAYVLRNNDLIENSFVGSALVDMYCNCRQVESGRRVFDHILGRRIELWNAMISGYARNGLDEKALILFIEMIKVAGLLPNTTTMASVMPACVHSLAAIAKGKEIHAYAIRNMLASDITVGSALVDMYAKCGCLNLSRRVFNEMPNKNVITWNVLIMACGMHGKGEEALELFKNMVAEAGRGGEAKPNEVTFITVFAACSHSGLISEGLNLFYRMKHDHGVEPTSDHYACVVDLLGRAGQLEEAYELVNTMPAEFDKVGAWSSLLGACRIHQNVELGEVAAKNLLHLEPNVASHYVLLSNIYSSAGLWNKAMEVRKNMRQMGVKKEPGCSWIEFRDEVHKFMAGDVSHPQSEQLHGFLETLSEKMRKEGYVPDTSCVLHNVDEDEKENLLCGHSEKLAIAFGILNTPPGTTIRVAKNLRVCNDCHAATKFISKIMEREIIVRDVRRFHHFKEGTCSCGDYW